MIIFPQQPDDLVRNDTEQLKLEISQLKDELKAKSNQLELLNKVIECWKLVIDLLGLGRSSPRL